MGSGDWNDGMNRVGHEGRGESVWLGWFLVTVLNEFAPICERAAATATWPQRYRNDARWLTGMLELSWDGGWYRRAYFDDGTPLGSAQNEECRIDSLTQSWAVLSEAAQPRACAGSAMEAVRAHLVRRDAQIVLLLTPPFDRMAHDPGYIKGYLPGIRENGGQYTHAALWTVIALARLGLGDEAMELFHMLNPINHTRTAEGVERYRASRMWWPPTSTRIRCTSDAAAGRGTPGRPGGCIGRRSRGCWGCAARARPSAWTRRSRRCGRILDRVAIGRTRYRINVTNPEHRCRGVRSATLDGVSVDRLAIPLTDDGHLHHVEIILGREDEPVQQE